MEVQGNGFLHARLHERPWKDEANPVGTFGGMTKELLRQRSLSTEGWISVDDAAFGKVDLQEVCLPNARMQRLQVIPGGVRDKIQKDTRSRRRFNPLR
jgi:hypothetical protein